MKKKVIILVLLIMLLFGQVGYLNAQEENTGLLGFNTGNKYLELPEHDRLIYVIGLIDMFWYMYSFAFPNIYEDIRARMKDMTGEQIKKIFDKYLEEHPEKLHFSAAQLFNLAMIDVVYD